MTDPVLAADGHTYNRTNILAWFARSGPVSMATGGMMPEGSTALVPNKVARDLIARLMLSCLLRKEGKSNEITSPLYILPDLVFFLFIIAATTACFGL